MKFTKTYENGLRLILEKNEKDVLSANFIFNVGSQNENKEQEGFAHFIEHLIFKGTKKISAVDVMDKFSFWGADYNAYTTKLATKFVFKSLKENFENCFELYSQILIDAEFNKVDIDRERQVVIEEMKKCDDDPDEILYKRVMENYFAGLPLAHDELGTESNIENATREELLKFKNKYYRAENCVISVAGNIEFDELDKIVEKHFSSRFKYLSKYNHIDFKQVVVKPSKTYDIVERNDNQANVCVQIKSASACDEEKYVADLYTSILGNSQNSRLFKTIREKFGLVYSIYAYNEMSPNAGQLLIVFGTRPKNVKKAMKEIKNILLDLANNGVTEEELKRAKNLKISSFLFGMETNSNLAEINGTILNYYDKVFDIGERCKKTELVTKSQVDDFAKRIASEKIFNVVAVGKGINIESLKIF